MLILTVLILVSLELGWHLPGDGGAGFSYREERGGETGSPPGSRGLQPGAGPRGALACLQPLRAPRGSEPGPTAESWGRQDGAPGGGLMLAARAGARGPACSLTGFPGARGWSREPGRGSWRDRGEGAGSGWPAPAWDRRSLRGSGTPGPSQPCSHRAGSPGGGGPTIPLGSRRSQTFCTP